MVEVGGGSIDKLADLEKQEAALWRTLEREIQSHGMKMAQRDAAKDALTMLDAVEEFRETARVIADGIRELTTIIRQELLIKSPGIQVDQLATQVDATLKAKIEFHFRPHVLPDTTSGAGTAK